MQTLQRTQCCARLDSLVHVSVTALVHVLVTASVHIREQLGLKISKQFRVFRGIYKHLHQFKSQSSNSNYHVNLTKIGFSCSYPDYNYRGVKGKHVRAVELSYALRQEVENVVIPEITLQYGLK